MIPKIGLGTWQNTDPEECREAVEYALNTGYTHIDTAQIYENEEYVGDGIAAADVDRDDFFLATKVWVDKLGYDDVIESTEESLEKLGVDYVDSLYVHWPAHSYDAEETMPAFDELKDDGRTKRIGVSNFTPELVEEAREAAENEVSINQVETHPLLQQEEMVEFTQENDIEIVAYSPLARGKVFNIPELEEIAEKHGCSPAQVSLAWLMSIDNVHPIPKSANKEHIDDNRESLELSLDDEDIRKIESIDEEERLIAPEKLAPW